MPPLKPAPLPESESDAAAHERTHVHAVYDSIAAHFSATRYKPWPIIAAFLASLPAGSTGLDSGTGNGKYLPLTSGGAIHTLGLDRSRALLEIARDAGGARRDVVWGDALGSGWRDGAFDYAISIATIHHFAAAARRQRAIEVLLRCVAPRHGRVLIYVWAVEQDALSRRAVPADAQDVLVPWVRGAEVHERYYHLFAAGELRALVCAAAAALGLDVEIVRDGWERSNWYIELRRGG